ncbi:MAG: M20/M25/M40 family metallo-hydrolase [Clostridia bacterium]|nr:M20/M25/M40 family metallo-hydrolase [Clostridia bacterium]
MNCDKLFEIIDFLNSDYVNVWVDVCNIESPTKYKAGVDACGEYFAAMANERGWKVEYFRQPVAGDIVDITLNPDADAKPIIFSAHLDTVHPVGSFGTPAVKIEGDKMYGPGVADCKGGAVAAFLAMDALDKCGFRSRPVKLILQTDEEVSSMISNKATIGYMCERALESVAFLNLEGYATGQACLQRKGTITFTFTVEGIEAHGSLCATQGASAILDAAHKIIELEKLKDAEGLTCNCGVISGGSVPNTVPGHCEFKANVRFANSEQLAWVRNHVKEVAATVHVPGCKCTVNNPKGRVAMELSEKNVTLLARMNEIFAENGLPELKAVKHTGASDAADVTHAGAACIDSIGVRGGKIHSPAEFAYIESLAESAKRLAAVAANI